ncbi:MAG: hypothetical protein H0U18_12300 [Pyrinomonadaceae bacterium]|nr:hypothetical protein [Pyrinomonadaceae bacterium]
MAVKGEADRRPRHCGRPAAGRRGKDMPGWSGYQRRRVATKRDTGRIRYTDHIVAEGERLFGELERRHLEGMVAKRADSLYVGGRCPYQELDLGSRTILTPTVQVHAADFLILITNCCQCDGSNLKRHNNNAR